MNLQWIDESPLYIYFTNEDREYFKWGFRTVISNFYNKYPTPKDWLKSDKEAINYYYTSELVYILYWVKECNIWDIKEYRQIIFDYLLSKGRNPYFKTFCIKLELMTEEDFEEIKSLSNAVKIQRVAMACILYNKNFKDITDEEISEFCEFNKDKSFTPRGVSNLRIKLGVSNKKALRRSRKTNWDYLFEHEKFGKMFSEYYKILKSSSTKDYLQSHSTAMKHLLNFMETAGLEDFTSFDESTFEELIDYLETELEISPSSICGYIPRIVHLMNTNNGDEFFPKEVRFCESFWSSYSRRSKKISYEKDGLAFSEAVLAPKIVQLLKEFEPTNDVEFLCKNYWLVIASCPARMKYILTLGAKDAIKPMPNEPNSFGIYSSLTDKSGRKYAQYPILDKMGVDAIKEVQEYVSKLNLKPIYDPSNGKTYTHLFQLPHEPWFLDTNIVYNFFQENILSKIKESHENPSEIRASAHSFRHYLLTYIIFITGDIDTGMTASGHRNSEMFIQYLRSKASRTCLLFRVVDKYENNEITGKFYLKLIHLLTSNDTPVDDMLYALTTEMKMDEFFNTYGKRTESGYCFSNENCSKWYACWGCSNFIMTRNEISQAIKILSNQILELKNLQQCTDFSFDAPSIKAKLNLICLIIKRLTELGLTEENINTMVNNCFENKDLMLGVELND